MTPKRDWGSPRTVNIPKASLIERQSAPPRSPWFSSGLSTDTWLMRAPNVSGWRRKKMPSGAKTTAATRPKTRTRLATARRSERLAIHAPITHGSSATGTIRLDRYV